MPPPNNRSNLCCEQENDMHREVALAFLKQMTDEGFHAARHHLTDDYAWWTPGLGLLDMEQMYPRFQSLLAGPVTLLIKGTTVEGERVAVEAESQVDLKNGKRYNNHYHFLFVFHGDKIGQVMEYNDTAHAAAVLR
jgi:ketosteroid isomerase-like protein